MDTPDANKPAKADTILDSSIIVAAKPAVAAAAPAVTKAQIEAVVEEWFTSKLRGGAVARYAEAYAQVFTAKPDLVDRLTKLFTPGA